MSYSRSNPGDRQAKKGCFESTFDQTHTSPAVIEAIEWPIQDIPTMIDDGRVTSSQPPQLISLRHPREMDRDLRSRLQSSPESESAKATEWLIQIQDEPMTVDNDCVPSSQPAQLTSLRHLRDMHRNEGRSTLQQCPTSDGQTGQAKEPNDNDTIVEISGYRKPSRKDDLVPLVNCRTS